MMSSTRTLQCTAEDWVRMYGEGATGAEIVKICSSSDPLEILTVLAAAKRTDPALEARHAANLHRNAREHEEYLARNPSFTPSWRRRLDELSAYVRDNGRMPRQVGGDAQETALGRWLHAQRGKVDKGLLGSRQRAALDAIGVWDSDRRQDRDMARLPDQLRALAAFRARHKRWPTYMNRADAQERALGTWLYTVRQAAREHRLPEPIRQALDDHAPGWFA
jgi:hypothetical protein